MVSKALLSILTATAMIGTGAAYAQTVSNGSAASVTSQSHPVLHYRTEPLKDVASLLGLDKSTLINDLKAGQSLAQIAQNKGISEQTLLDELKAKLKDRLDQAVANGKLSADQENQILSNADSKLKQLVEKTGGFTQGKKGKKFAFGVDRKIAAKNIASFLGIDENTLKSELKSGKSLAEVAQSKGISEQALISELQNQLKSRLDQAVANGKITAAQENNILSKFSAKIQTFVEKKGGIQKHQNVQQTQDQA